MARVLISPLGLGKAPADRGYSKTKYKFEFGDGGIAEYETSFFASALAEELDIDKIFFVGTVRSMWEQVYYYFMDKAHQGLNEDYWMEVGKMAYDSRYEKPLLKTGDLDKANEAIDIYLKHIYPEASGGSRCFIIDYGVNQEELWNNFDIFMGIGDNLNRGDEVYLDITHSFRSIPIFMYLMMNFIQTLNYEKEIKLAGIYYGMLDASKEFGYTPVVDLSPLFEISSWARGVYDYTNYGNGYLIAELLDDKGIGQKIKNTSELLNINYLTDLKREIDSLNHYLDKLEDLPTPVFKYLKPYLNNFIKRFKGINTNSGLQFELAKWYFENKRYSNGYICLAESIVTKIAEAYGDAGYRIGTSSAQRDKIKSIMRTKFKTSDIQSYKLLYENYDAINKIRNVIAHAGYIEDEKGPRKHGRLRVGYFQQDIEECQTHLKSIYKLLFDNREIKDIPKLYPL